MSREGRTGAEAFDEKRPRESRSTYKRKPRLTYVDSELEALATLQTRSEPWVQENVCTLGVCTGLKVIAVNELHFDAIGPGFQRYGGDRAYMLVPGEMLRTSYYFIIDVPSHW